MQKTRLGRRDLDITPIGFGARAIDVGNWTFGWGPQDDGAGTFRLSDDELRQIEDAVTNVPTA